MDPPDITKYPHSLSGSDVMETIVPFTKSNNKVELSVKHVFHLLKLIRSSYLIVNNLFHVLKMIIRLSYFALISSSSIPFLGQARLAESWFDL